jgi:RNA polymerase sigma-70 factor, ECF subfamily
LNIEQAELIRRAQAGDLDAFRRIHEEYGRRILNFVYRLVDVREDAEDLAQNVFLKAYADIGRLQDTGKFESWLYRIARNEVYQSYRKRRAQPEVVDGDPGEEEERRLEGSWADSRPTPQETILQGELGSRIRDVLAALPPKHREVFVLAVIEEKSYAEIAEIVGRSLLSVKTDIFRARSYARKALGRYLEEGV